MALLTEYVEVHPCGETKYYEQLGYEIPRVYNSKTKKYIIPRSATMKVKVQDLKPNSTARIEVQCERCGKIKKIMYLSYRKTVERRGKYYCHKCVLKLFNTGINNPSYNPNINDEERIIKRNYPEYIEFVKKVLARDNYTCQCCGCNIRKYLLVHHLNGYNWCIDERLDERNGVVLCINCHLNFHSKYGKGNNTKEQYLEWIGKSELELESFNGVLPIAKMMYCFEEDTVYNSVLDFMKKHDVKFNSQVYGVCNHWRHTVKGFHIFWLTEYNTMDKETLQRYIDNDPLLMRKKNER